MKASSLGPAILLAAAVVAAHASGPAPAAAPSRAVQVCAGDNDAENLCKWDAPPGTRGRKCVLDVEHISRKDVCAYDRDTAAEMTDHKPMCISAHMAEHIVFQSSNGRTFRVRRLVPINKTSDSGAACPAHPFKREFHAEDFNFAGTFDTTEPKLEAVGCRYKLEVQFLTIDPNAPVATFDPQHRHLECRDPHLGITKTP
jgi:hypothetical protein